MAIRQQQIVDAIKTQLLLIVGTTPYTTNLGTRVSIWEGNQGDPGFGGEMPMAKIRDLRAECVAQDMDQGLEDWELYVDVDLACEAGRTSDTTIRIMINDVIHALGLSRTLGGLALNIQKLGFDMTVDEEEKVVGGATVHFKVLFQTTEWSET
jgi:hypothetical protein